MVSTRIEGNLTQHSKRTLGKLLGEMTISFFFLSVPSLYPQTQSILNAWHLVYTELNVNFNKFVNQQKLFSTHISLSFQTEINA